MRIPIPMRVRAWHILSRVKNIAYLNPNWRYPAALVYHEAKGFIIFKSPGFLEIQLANDGADMMGGFGGVVLGERGQIGGVY